MTSNTAHAAQAVIVRHGDVERLELPGATLGLLADSGTTRATLGANQLGTGADGATPRPTTTRRQRHLDHDTRSRLVQGQSTRASTFG
jgi:hypothetical protein